MAGSSWNVFTELTRSKASQVNANFDWLENDVVPMAAGTKADNTYDLGTSLFRWRYVNAGTQFYGPGGTVAAPTYANLSNANAGLYFNSAYPRIAANGVFAQEWRENGGATQSLIVNGSLAAPALAFSSETSLGLYRATTSAMGLSGDLIRPSMSAFLAILQTNLSGYCGANIAYTDVTAFTEIEDRGNNYAAGVFTALVGGLYQFNAHLDATFATLTANNVMEIRTTSRGYQDRYLSAGAGTSRTFNVEVLAPMAAGDTAKVRLYIIGQTSAQTTITGTTTSEGATGFGTYFSGFLVG